MSNLIPEQRVDKNGRTVTRHVRANSSPSAGKAIPSPSLGRKPSKAGIEKKIRSIIFNVGDFKANKNLLEQKLRNMDPELVSRIEVASRGTEDTKLWEGTHSWLIHDIIITPDDADRTLCLNAIEAFNDDYQEWADIRSLMSLRKIPEFAPYAEDFREAPPSVLSDAQRLGHYRTQFEGLGKLYFDTRTNNRLKSRELESIIINEADKAADFNDWLIENSDKSLHHIDSKLVLRVINKPEERERIAGYLGQGVTNTDLIELVLDRPESEDEIFNLYSGGVKQIPAIIEVLDGNVKSSLASGIL